MTDPAIRVDGLSFSYGDLLAVDNVSFEVAPGEILGFLGPNGAGKSTTIKVLTGQLTQTSGEATVLGMDVVSQRDEVQGRIGVSFEEKNLYENMSAKENLSFFASLFGIKGFDPNPLLKAVGLEGRGDERVSGFSKGMQQRLMVARSLVNDPEVLFLDEPTDGLDPVSSNAIRALITEQAERGVAVILTTHDMLEADKLSDRVAFINEGAIVALDTPEALKMKYGSRTVRLRFTEGDGVREEVVSLEEGNAGDALKAAVSNGDLATIHTEEATLEQIFIEITGRGLES